MARNAPRESQTATPNTRTDGSGELLSEDGDENSVTEENDERETRRRFSFSHEIMLNLRTRTTWEYAHEI